jgi:hypothetical protein
LLRWQSAAVGQQLGEVGGGEPGRDGFESRPVRGQVHDGGVGLQDDGGAGAVWAEPELLPADLQVPLAGTVRSISTARLTGSTPLVDITNGTGNTGGCAGRAGGAGPVGWVDSASVSCAGAGRGAGADGVRVRGSRSGSRSSVGRGVNRSAGKAKSSDWCGRLVLYSCQKPSTPACKLSTSDHTSRVEQFPLPRRPAPTEIQRAPGRSVHRGASPLRRQAA